MSPDDMIKRVAAEEVMIKKLATEGRLIEAGWESYRLTVLPKEAGRIQIRETKAAFYAGAMHLFTSILSAVDPGEEPTEADLKTMELVQKELLAFGEEFKAEIARRKAQRN